MGPIDCLIRVGLNTINLLSYVKSDLIVLGALMIIGGGSFRQRRLVWPVSPQIEQCIALIDALFLRILAFLGRPCMTCLMGGRQLTSRGS